MKKHAKMSKFERYLLIVKSGIQNLQQSIESVEHFRCEGTVYVLEQMEEDCRTLEAQIKSLRQCIPPDLLGS